MDEAVRARPEAWMAVNAICNGMKCSQSYLGPRAALPGGPDIVETIRQTVGNLFYCCDAFQDHWLDRQGTESVQTFGSDHELTPEDAPARPDKSFELFRTGVQSLQDVLKSILAKDTLAQLKQIATKDIDQFDFPSELWVRILYDFVAAYHRTSIARDHILQSLVPLYRGQLFSFLADHAQSSPEEMEADTEALCLEFERQKPYLIERWKAKS
jgi:glucosylglycerate synthase